MRSPQRQQLTVSPLSIRARHWRRWARWGASYPRWVGVGRARSRSRAWAGQRVVPGWMRAGQPGSRQGRSATGPAPPRVGRRYPGGESVAPVARVRVVVASPGCASWRGGASVGRRRGPDLSAPAYDEGPDRWGQGLVLGALVGGCGDRVSEGGEGAPLLVDRVVAVRMVGLPVFVLPGHVMLLPGLIPA